MKRLTSVFIGGHEFLFTTTSAPVLGDTAVRPAGPVRRPGGPDTRTGRASSRAASRAVGALRQPGG